MNYNITNMRLEKRKIGEYSVDVFTSDKGMSIEVVPEEGCTVLDIVWREESLLDGYNTEADIRRKQSNRNEFLFPFGGRLKQGRYTWNKKEYQFPQNHDEHAIHGFLQEEAFDLQSYDEATIVYTAEIAPRSYYPFPSTVSIVFQLHADAITIVMSVMNTGVEAMPAGIGWHPYFRVGSIQDTEVNMPESTRIQLTGDLIPTGRTEKTTTPSKEALGSIDSVYLCVGKEDGYQVEVITRSRTISMTVPIKEDLPYFVLYCPPDQKSLALEPMSAAPDVLNNHLGLAIIEAGEKKDFIFAFSFEENR